MKIKRKVLRALIEKLESIQAGLDNAADEAQDLGNVASNEVDEIGSELAAQLENLRDELETELVELVWLKGYHDGLFDD